MTEHETYIETAQHAAREAGTVLLHHLGNLREIEVKNQQQFNLVTEADRNAERRIVDILLEAFPGHGILGEEGGAHNIGASHRWIIDPLDGTTNYTHAFPIFSISIALERDGELLAGVIHDPVRDELFHAARGAGAFLNGKRIHVSDISRIEKAMLVTGFPYNIRENPDYCYERFIGFLKEAQAIRRLGSAALDCAYVAAGRLDGFWEVALQPWDKAAGHLLIEEAGGRVSDFAGAPHDIHQPPFLGSNGRIHDDMLRVLEEAKSLVITMKARE
ncbi:MAG: inositol monophosphatase [Bacteroidetes bacterium]|nr:inositol monophosphatase [Bacteroidota bacterium]